MTDPAAPRRGRHASPEDDVARFDAGRPGADRRPVTPFPRTSPNGAFRPEPWDERPWDDSQEPHTPGVRDDAAPAWAPESRAAGGWDADTGAWSRGLPRPRAFSRSSAGAGHGGEFGPAGSRQASGLLDRYPEDTGAMPIAEARHHSGGDDDGPVDGRATAGSAAFPSDGSRPSATTDPTADGRIPSTPVPPLPSGAWSRLQPRADEPADDAETQAGGPLPAVDGGPDGADTAGTPLDWDDRTGALDVIGAHVDEERTRRGLFRRSRGPQADAHDAYVDDDAYDDGYPHDNAYDDGYAHDEADTDTDVHPGLSDRLTDPDRPADEIPFEDIPVAPYDHRRNARRRRRRRLAALVAVLVLVGVGVGAVLGGRQILGLVHSPDYTGEGSGSVRIRVHDGDSLKAIAQTLVDDGVIASVRPFVKAAEADPHARSIVPGLYGLHRHMSGTSALQLLLDPSSRLVSRVTVPEGLTVTETLQRLAQNTGIPLAQFTAAAADPASLGLPSYANGKLEGFLFPATYDFEPGTAPATMLQTMVGHAVQTLDQLQIPVDQRANVLTEASIVQAEAGSAADMPKIARVIDNRLAQNMPLQLDTTVNYATGKSGLTTTAQDRANPSPYNTYLHPGLPPGPISNPGEEALRAVLNPAQGDWLYFVVINPDTGETRFAATGEEHQKNVALFQQWLKAHPNG